MNKNVALAGAGVVVVAVAAYLFAFGSPSLKQPVASNVPTPSAPTSTKTPTPSSPAIAAGAPSSTVVGLSSIDSTWKTYTSRAGDFSFQTPTKGRYTPSWEVSFSDTDCAGAGAMKLGQTTFFVDGVSFCHTSFSEGAAGSVYFMDVYTTKQGSRYITVTFTKQGYSAGALNCSFVSAHPYSTSATTCIPFEETAYQAQLDQIISTFQFLKS
jgi:hypothetical protein